MPLYHITLGIPTIKYPTGRFKLKYSTHAEYEAMRDEYGEIKNLPEYLDTSTFKKIEVETDDDGKLLKILYKTTLDEARDLCLAVYMKNINNMIVKTVWSEEKGDNHKRLNTKRYHGG